MRIYQPSEDQGKIWAVYVLSEKIKGADKGDAAHCSDLQVVRCTLEFKGNKRTGAARLPPTRLWSVANVECCELCLLGSRTENKTTTNSTNHTNNWEFRWFPHRIFIQRSIPTRSFSYLFIRVIRVIRGFLFSV